MFIDEQKSCFTKRLTVTRSIKGGDGGPDRLLGSVLLMLLSATTLS